MINQERLAATFKSLVQIDSVSKNEAALARAIREILLPLGPEIVIDEAGKQIGSDTGNLIAKFKGNVAAAPLLLNAHMDTVDPGRGVKPVLKDGLFTSDGTTILGADDKGALAILIEALRVLQENKVPHGPLELVLTVCEEIGLQGAKHLDTRHISAKFGFALDATDTEGIVTRAPSANRLEFNVYGKAAHAGAAPENGINAILLASRAIAGLKLGRIDRETTCNLGVIQGGVATNIVPNRVTVHGEVRSHDEKKLEVVTAEIVSSFRKAVDDFEPLADGARPRLDVAVEHDFSHTHIPDDHPVVVLAQQAAGVLGRKMVPKITGGGADANVFFKKGIMVGVLGTGMRDMHTVNESIRLEDMVRTAELIVEIVRLHAAGAKS